MTCELRLPDDFDDYAWEVEAKGWFPADVAVRDGGVHQVIFYDPVRLRQDVEADLAESRPATFARLVVVERVTATAMTHAVANLPAEFFA